MNFYGLETEKEDFVCSWVNPPEYYLDILQLQMNINTVRVPFSYAYIQKGQYNKLSHFLDETDKRNMSVILDYHRTTNTHQSATPENDGITREEFVECWLRVMRTFHVHPSVKGIGIFNEIQHQTPDYVMSIHHDVMNAVEEDFPGRFHYFRGCTSWGTNCSGTHFLEMPYWNRSYIEIHAYEFNGNSTTEELDVKLPLSIPADHWFVGETGFKQDDERQEKWIADFLGYLETRNISNLCLWTIAHSQDTNGWWEDDCITFKIQKADVVNRFWEKASHV